eukprot:CAMPEP_0116009292 /NCGR_PEP_ID=MMETSP0321-20121206/3349_1 /TAXON_ID=163516 /ORGANISM="Leptocylindrus danicus var. danicus, Strain B650" /LENGTH=123 /DNA_ID=CAMNT_0003478233 /DNA_START=124 /DNA_END=495 /DNA_ORIENTATION=+
MSHGVLCNGFIIEEQHKPGRLKPELVVPVIERKSVILKEKGGRHPMRVLRAINNLSEDESFTFPGRTDINRVDVVDKDEQCRMVVVCRNMADARTLENLALGVPIDTSLDCDTNIMRSKEVSN